MNPLIHSTTTTTTTTTTTSSSNFLITSRKVAVIGAGAAGLVASRELRKEGHNVVVFERSDRIGGTWVYEPNVESDPLGIDPSRTIVNSSMYESLRTNLPREIMGFRDYPFVAVIKDESDPRRYPGHKEVLSYLKDFANDFQLNELIRFETEVIHVELVVEGKWIVKSKNKRGGGACRADDEMFDALVICTGHFTEPNIAEIPGIDAWPGQQIHSHNYRVPEPYRNQVVLLIGNAPSAWDISRDVARVAKEVHVASRSFINETPRKQLGHDNITLHSMIERVYEDGTVVFQDGSSVYVDAILHCTGYKYYFPFLKYNDIVTVDDNRVGPLYKHVFPPLLAPWISFISIPWRAAPFPLCELQSKWVAGVLSGRISLPSQEKMTADVEAFYFNLEAIGVPKRYTHNLMDNRVEYINWLTDECGSVPWEEWRKQMEVEACKRIVSQPETYRDEWDDEHLILQAQEEFHQYLPTEL